MELVKVTPEDQAKIDHDKQSTHAVEILRVQTQEIENVLASKIVADALTRIGARAIKAKMAVLSTNYAQNAYLERQETERGGVFTLHWMVISIFCHWAEIEKLEANRRQQELMGQSGPRRA